MTKQWIPEERLATLTRILQRSAEQNPPHLTRADLFVALAVCQYSATELNQNQREIDNAVHGLTRGNAELPR